ncbi:MAG: aminoacyl-tRNA hydrolase [Bacilli bacterium]|nr:aminoacyl-tRNA hydrolase [Bacilli bacterium]
MKLIVGLGNPGKKYELTRHNCGFLIIDNFAKKHCLSFKSKYNGLYTEQLINGEKVILLKPQTYMNLSGNCVQKFVKFYNIDMNDLYVIHDDINFEVGKYKIRRNGSDGGHNGIKSIIHSLNSQDFHRIKIGINKNEIPLEDYVLQKIPRKEFEIIKKVIEEVSNIIEDVTIFNIDKIMEKYNS